MLVSGFPVRRYLSAFSPKLVALCSCEHCDCMLNETTYPLKTTHVVSFGCTVLFLSCFLGISMMKLSVISKSYYIKKLNKTFFTSWPWPMTYELDLDILPPDLHAKNQVCMSVCLAVRATQTHTHTMPKLLHPLLVQGVIIECREIFCP